MERRRVTVGEVKVLAPATMTVLSTKPGPGEPFADLPPFRRLQYLLLSLTPAQWDAIGKDGLGQSDLADAQRALFASFVPSPFVYQKSRVARSRATQWETVGERAALPDSARPGVRLRLVRHAAFQFPIVGKPNAFLGQDLPAHPDGSEVLTLVPTGDDLPAGTVFGERLRAELPSRAKPGQLNFAAPNLQKRLTADDVKTVGALVERAAKACQAELFADQRLARLPVKMDGAATAGEWLNALARGVNGTWRKVGPAYVLTDDMEGFGTRTARLAEWVADRRAWLENQLAEWRKKSAAATGAQAVGFAKDDPLALPPDWKSGEAAPLDTLPAPMQNALRQTAARLSGIGQTPLTLDATLVKTDTRMELQFVLPGGEIVEQGVGGFSSVSLSGLTAVGEKAKKAESDASGIIAAAPKNADELPALVRQAKAANQAQFYLLLPDDEAQADTLLQAAVNAAKASNLPVVAVISLLTKPTPDAQSLDKNVMGETSGEWEKRRGTGEKKQWRTPETIAGQTARLQKLAATPGLSGLALRDWATPGYFDKPTNETRTLGYTTDARLTFLRKNGVDPIDIADFDFERIGPAAELLSLPNFAPDKTRTAQWQSFRRARLQTPLDELRKTLHDTQPTLGLFLCQSADGVHLRVEKWLPKP